MDESVSRVRTRSAITSGIHHWNDRHEGFTIREELVAQNVFAPFAGLARSAWALSGDPKKGFAILTQPAESAGEFPPADTAWISLAVGSDRTHTATLLEAVTSILAVDGAETVWFGNDPQHFLPGLPGEITGDLRKALLDTGFELGETVVDLTRRLSTYETPPSVAETTTEWDCRVERATGRRAELLSVIDGFSDRWLFEAENTARVPGGLDGYWLLYADGEAIGFLRSSTPDSTVQSAGRTWIDRFPESVVSIGPLGVHPEYRGRGWGLAMIDTVLRRHRQEGYGRAIIDWTPIAGFYERLGFETYLEYEYAKQSLSPGV